MLQKSFYILSALLVLLVSCNGTSNTDTAVVQEEDLEAKKMLQGIWIDSEDDEVTLRIKDDSIIYADTAMNAVRFAVIGDTLVLTGFSETKYHVEKITPNLFYFRNQYGDLMKLVKSTNQEDNYVFENRPKVAINQRQLIKRDSVVTDGTHRYRVYVQVNPSTYKVVRTSINQDGMSTENVYYDNIVNVCVFNGAQRFFSRDFRKQDFSKYVPAEYLSQSILSDISIGSVTPQGIELEASVCVPDSPTSYIVKITITHSGKLQMRQG